MTATLTERVVADMLTENTGRHMLDSGGAYGRSWERNQGLDVEAFKAMPEATLDRWGCVTLSVFHWVTGRLTYLPDEDAAFHEWAQSEEHADEPWLESARIWAEEHNVQYGDMQTINTYNGEDFLSQTLQWVEWEQDGEYGSERRILLQVHGGCDVRGGYTAPRMFALQDYVEGLWDNADATIYCQGSVTDETIIGQMTIDGQEVTTQPTVYHHWDVRGGSVDYFLTRFHDIDGTWHDDESYGSDTSPLYDNDLETDDDDRPLCPVCKSVLGVEAPQM